MTASPFRVGAIEVHVLLDGSDRVPPEMILAGAPADELKAFVGGEVDGDGMLPVAYNCLLIRSGGRLVLVDAGFGELSESEGTGGDLLAGLRALGVAPEQVDAVVISHGHADHIGGLTRTASGRAEPVFPRAEHWFRREEWAFWTSEETLRALPAGLAEPARAILRPLASAGVVKLADSEIEVAEGVRILSAPGHTPGHVAVAVESGGDRTMYVGDAIFHPLNLEQPDWTCVFDVDRGAATRTRRRLLDLAAGDGRLVLAAHVAGPGRVERRASGYRWLAAQSPA